MTEEKKQPRNEHRNRIIRNPDRIIELTPEALANLPLSYGHNDIWYDKDHPFLQVRRAGNAGHSYLRYTISNSLRVRRGALRSGVTLGQIHRIGDDLELSVAREMASKVKADLIERFEHLGAPIQGDKEKNRVTRMVHGGTKIPKPKDPNIEKLLRGNTSSPPDMQKLWDALSEAFTQACAKGQDRHGAGESFQDQDMIHIQNAVGVEFALGQAIKKLCEGRRMSRTKARVEFLGAINYIAGAIVWMDQAGK